MPNQDSRISCIIVDDEASARDVLRIYLSEFIKGVDVLDECKSVPEAVKSIRKYRPQLVFLDIGMPHFSGLELPNFFEEGDMNFQIIFTTAYKEYAVEAFRLSAIDYLLKPVNLQDLQEAIDKCRTYSSIALRHKGLVQNLKNDAEKVLHVKVLNKEHLLPVSDIIMLKASGAYTEIFVEGSEQCVLASRHLKHFAEVLSHFPSFMRCHRSFVVNTQKIKSIQRGTKTLKLESGLEASFNKDWLTAYKENN